LPEKNERTHIRCYSINQRRNEFTISRAVNVSDKVLLLAAFLCQCAGRLIYVFGTLKDLKMEYPPAGQSAVEGTAKLERIAGEINSKV